MLTPSKRGREDICEDVGSEEEEEDCSDAEITVEKVSDGVLVVMAQWEEPQTLTKRVNVYIHMWAGISSNMFTITTVDDGRALEFRMDWPETMKNVDLMHRKWRNLPPTDPSHMSTHHVELLAFQKALQKYRANYGENIQACWKIPMPIRVRQNPVSQSLLRWSGSENTAIYVRYKGVDESYGNVRKQLTFEVV